MCPISQRDDEERKEIVRCVKEMMKAEKRMEKGIFVTVREAYLV
jgi:hypothetical protein